MELTSRQTIEYLCKKYNFWPQRSAGQNFLISSDVLDAIIDAADLSVKDTILEIGAGFGTLTSRLLIEAKKVFAVELDKRLAEAMKKLAAVNRNLCFYPGDIFKVWKNIYKILEDQNYKLVSNLPYNITSLVLRNFLENKPRPSLIVVLVQKEVAERVVAEPGEMSLLAVAVQYFGQPEIIKVVSKRDFWPVPEIDSAILKISGIGADKKGYRARMGNISDKEFFRIVKIGFSAKRKQLHNNFSAGLRLSDDSVKEIFSQAGIPAAARAQDLSLDEWISLTHNITNSIARQV